MIEPILLRQALYRLFAWLYLYPEPERLARLQNGAAVVLALQDLWSDESYAPALKGLLAWLAEAGDEAAEKELAGEYMRLFTIQPAAAPYESVYTAPHAEGRGWVTAQLERVYARHELAMSALNELPDHLAVELEFVSVLCERQAEALQRGDAPTADELGAVRQAFLDNHLLRWVPTFSERIARAAPGSRYSLVTEALLRYLAG